MAEDCHPPRFIEGLYWRKDILRIQKTTAIYDGDLNRSIQNLSAGVSALKVLRGRSFSRRAMALSFARERNDSKGLVDYNRRVDLSLLLINEETL